MKHLFARWFGSRAARRPPRAMLSVEPLEERSVPTVFTTKIDRSGPGDEGPESASPVFRSGVLRITPLGDEASAHTIVINTQVSQVSLPSGEVIPGHGLKTAKAQNPVVDWTPT